MQNWLRCHWPVAAFVVLVTAHQVYNRGPTVQEVKITNVSFGVPKAGGYAMAGRSRSLQISSEEDAVAVIVQDAPDGKTDFVRQRADADGGAYRIRVRDR